MLGAPASGREPRTLDEVGAAHQTQHALGDALRAGRDREPPAVRGAIGVARRVVDGTVPGARLHLAELVVRGDLRTEQPQQRLDEREVDDLSAPARPPRVERGHHAVRERERRDAIRQTERRQLAAVGASDQKISGPEQRREEQQRVRPAPEQVGEREWRRGGTHGADPANGSGVARQRRLHRWRSGRRGHHRWRRLLDGPRLWSPEATGLPRPAGA